MANLAIIDTGYINSGIVTGTQAPVITNSSSAINLKGVDIAYDASSNHDTSPVINSPTNSVVGMGSVNNPRLVVNGVLQRSSSTDMGILILLEQLRRTYGVKLIYYTDNTGTYYDIINRLGYENRADVHKANNFSGVDTPHLHVQVTGFNIKEAARGFLRYTLTMVVTS